MYFGQIHFHNSWEMELLYHSIWICNFLPTYVHVYIHQRSRKDLLTVYTRHHQTIHSKPYTHFNGSWTCDCTLLHIFMLIWHSSIICLVQHCAGKLMAYRSFLATTTFHTLSYGTVYTATYRELTVSLFTTRWVRSKNNATAHALAQPSKRAWLKLCIWYWAMNAAKDLLKRAVELDSAQKYSEALICYEEGIQNLLRAMGGKRNWVSWHSYT